MNRKTRFLILAVCMVLFFILAPSMVLYSEGYRIDFKNKRLMAIGGIYLKIWPEPAEAFVDSKIAGKTNMFSNSFFVQNLWPKNHAVLIKKDGYYDYQKTLAVKEKEVVKLEHVILFKQNILFETLADKTQSPFLKTSQFIIRDKNLYKNDKTAIIPLIKNVSLFDVSENNITWLGTDGSLYQSDLSGKAQNKIWETFYSPVKNIKVSPDQTKLLYYNDYEIMYSYLTPGNSEKIFLNRFSEKITDCQWLNNDYIVFVLEGRIKISEIDNRNEINIIEVPLEKNPKIIKIIFDQQDKKLYISTANDILVSEPLIP